MRVMLTITFPGAEFNVMVRDGSAGEKISRILETIKPESVYFTEYNGRRTALVVADLPDASRIPALAEPWFLQFNAQVEFRVVMTPEDLRRGDLAALGKKWA
jgi:hypothetical protein